MTTASLTALTKGKPQLARAVLTGLAPVLSILSTSQDFEDFKRTLAYEALALLRESGDSLTESWAGAIEDMAKDLLLPAFRETSPEGNPMVGCSL